MKPRPVRFVRALRPGARHWLLDGEKVDDGRCHRTQGGFPGGTTAPQGPGSASPAFPRLGAPRAPDTAAGRREVLLRPPAHLGAHPVLGAQLPAPGVQPGPDGREHRERYPSLRLRGLIARASANLPEWVDALPGVGVVPALSMLYAGDIPSITKVTYLRVVCITENFAILISIAHINYLKRSGITSLHTVSR